MVSGVRVGQHGLALAIERLCDAAPRTIVRGLRGALTPKGVEHRAVIIEPKCVGELPRAIDGYIARPSTRYALKLAPYAFVRPGELRAAEWFEFDLSAPSGGFPLSE